MKIPALQPDYSSNLHAQLTAARALLAAFTPYEGKFVRKLKKGTQAQLRGILAAAQNGAYRPTNSDVQAYSSTGAPFINCGKLLEQIQRIEADIAAITALSSLPETVEYLRALASFTQAYGKLTKAIAGTAAPRHWRRLLKVPNFPA